MESVVVELVPEIGGGVASEGRSGDVEEVRVLGDGSHGGGGGGWAAGGRVGGGGGMACSFAGGVCQAGAARSPS